MIDISLDLKDVLRGLRRDLGHTLTSVGILALTIGATTATFSIIRSDRHRARRPYDGDRCAARDDGVRPVLVPQPRRGGARDSHDVGAVGGGRGRAPRHPAGRW